jgi:hypothetical protein
MGPGGFLRLQNDCDLTTSGWVGSIPTRSRHRGCAFLLPLVVSLVVSFVSGATTALAQRTDTTRARPAPARRDSAQVRAAQKVDTLAPPITSRRAFLYSLAVPGLAQSKLDRSTAGAFYFTVEAIAIAMAVKSANDLRIARKHAREGIIAGYQLDANGAPSLSDGVPVPDDSVRNRYAGDRVKARRTHFEDWITAIVFTHLFSAADAFVSAQLWDLPARVEMRRLPQGTGVGASIRW